MDECGLGIKEVVCALAGTLVTGERGPQGWLEVKFTYQCLQLALQLLSSASRCRPLSQNSNWIPWECRTLKRNLLILHSVDVDVLSCIWFCSPMDCSLSGSSAHGIFQARVLEWGAISYSKRSSQSRDGIHISCVPALSGRFLNCSGEMINPDWLNLETYPILNQKGCRVGMMSKNCSLFLYQIYQRPEISGWSLLQQMNQQRPKLLRLQKPVIWTMN